MSSTGNAECAATPVRLASKRYHEDNASAMASPSVMSSLGNTIDTESFPSTPSQVTQRSAEVPLTRGRHNTISSIGDEALFDHAIFALGNVGFNDDHEQANVFASINDKQDRESAATEVKAKIEYRDTLQPPVVVSSERYATKDAGTTWDESAVEEPEEEGPGDEAQEANKEDLKDLAIYGRLQHALSLLTSQQLRPMTNFYIVCKRTLENLGGFMLRSEEVPTETLTAFVNLRVTKLRARRFAKAEMPSLTLLIAVFAANRQRST